MCNILKRFKNLFICVFVFGLLFGYSYINVNATESNNEFVIDSEKVPESAIEYIKSELTNILEAEKLDDNFDVKISNPFTIYSKYKDVPIYNFLISQNSRVISVIKIIDKGSGDYTWQTSKGYLVDKFNEFNYKTGTFKFKFEESINSRPELICEESTNPVNVVNLKEAFKIVDKNNLYNINEKIHANLKNFNLRSENYPYEKLLPIKPTESQGAESWCAAYAAATILSYELTQDIKAIDIMRWYFPSVPYSTLKNYSLTDTQIVNYAWKKGSYAVKVDYALSREEIMEEIVGQRMIYAGCRNVNKSTMHAMVVYGYTKDKYYYLWNPWGELLTTPMSSSDIYTYDQIHYYWEDSIKNWSW